jgi:gamma-glutamylaminecyclotransferase
MHLFVYGTLKDPHRMAAVVGPHVHMRVVGAGTVRGVLYDAGEYPALKLSASAGDVVRGQLLELDDAALPRLDRYEGVDSGLYVRQACDVRDDDGRVRAAWVYVYNRSVAALRRIAEWPPKRG